MDIYYETYGKGPAVICLHGNRENRKIFYQLKDDLSAEYQMILIDSRYHGKSIKSGELSLAQMAKDVMQVADECHLDSYDVIGFSDGANVALTLAGMDQRMKSGVLLAPNSSPKGIKSFYRFSYGLTLVLLIPFCLYNKVARRQFKLLRWMFQEPHFSEDDLKSLRIPFLVLSGDRDIIKKSDLEWITSHLPHAMHQVIADCGHFMLEDGYSQTIKKVRGFLYASNSKN